jgi:hypothetical protein
MAPKRKNDQVEVSGQPTGREKKKQRIADARTIAVQAAPSATGVQNAVAGPSGIDRFDSEFNSFSFLTTNLWATLFYRLEGLA